MPKYKAAIESIAAAAVGADAPSALHQQLDASRQLLALDEEQAETVSSQVRFSAAMEQLPSEEQVSFYRSKILPLVEHENSIETQKEPLMQKVRQLEAQLAEVK